MTRGTPSGNYISEWFGHRMFPTVVSSAESVKDQSDERCPFLSAAKGHKQLCVKSEAARGVCTISSVSNGPRQDWIACPYRAFDPLLMRRIVAHLYDLPANDVHLIPAPTLSEKKRQAEVEKLIADDKPVLVYFEQKMGGEIEIGATAKSPQVAFDVTFVRLHKGAKAPRLGKFAIVEVQTMDFHGSYRAAVKNLKDALRLHKKQFPVVAQANQTWMSEGIEGPNIANVFKRTFYQLMFKFEMALTPDCAGAALVLPSSVWDSWQKFLGAPQLRADQDRYVLDAEGGGELGAYIYVIDADATAPTTPSPLQVVKLIQTSAQALAHHALEKAPEGAIEQLKVGLYPVLKRRLREFWPIEIEIPVSDAVVGDVQIVEVATPPDVPREDDIV